MEKDNMSIGTKLVQGVLKRIIKKMIKTNLGIDVDIDFNDKLTLEYDEKEGAKAHLNLDVSMNSSEFQKLLSLF